MLQQSSSTDVANALVVSEGLVVLVRQPQKTPPIYWKLPGGRFKCGESPAQALHREIDEEVDLMVGGCQITELKAFPRMDRSTQVSYTQYLFLVRVPIALLVRHQQGVVTCTEEDVTIESTCFRVDELDRVTDFLGAHWRMLVEIDLRLLG